MCLIDLTTLKIGHTGEIKLWNIMKIFKNMSSRAAEMMKEDLESKGPVKLSEVEAQQKQILQIVRRLSDEGQIQLAGKGGDDQYV